MASAVSPSDAPTRPPDAAEHRRRLLDAMAVVVARKGYADATIADLAAEARVSRRTFYEHFQTKAQCLIALYEAASGQALRVLKEALDPARDWHAQLADALRAYLGTLASNPVLLSTLFIAILGLGPEGLAARRRANEEIAGFVVRVAGRSQPLPMPLAMAIVGGINELILAAIERGEAARLTELTPSAAAFARAVIDGAAGPAGAQTSSA